MQHTAGVLTACWSRWIWYQLGSRLAINPSNVIDQQDLSATSHGSASTCCRMTATLGRADDVSRSLSLDDPRRPWVEETIPAGVLGIIRVSQVLDDRVVVLGEGGVVDPVLDSPTRTDGVVHRWWQLRRGVLHGSPDLSVNDDEYVGSASQLHLPLTIHWGHGTIVFVRHEQAGSLVWLVDEDLLERDGERTTGRAGACRRVHAIDGGRWWHPMPAFVAIRSTTGNWSSRVNGTSAACLTRGCSMEIASQWSADSAEGSSTPMDDRPVDPSSRC